MNTHTREDAQNASSRARFAGMRRIASIMWTTLMAVILVAVVAVVAGSRATGSHPLVVTSGSMEPTIPTGSIVFAKEVPVATIDKGDVITFDPPGPTGRTTHRVVRINAFQGTRYFETRGDANPTNDDFRTSEQRASKLPPGVSYGGDKAEAVVVIGSVPYLGYVMVGAQQPWMRIALTALLGVIVASSLLRWIWSSPGTDSQARVRRGSGAP